MFSLYRNIFSYFDKKLTKKSLVCRVVVRSLHTVRMYEQMVAWVERGLTDRIKNN